MACRGLCSLFEKDINNRSLYTNGNVYCRACEVRFNLEEAKSVISQRPGFNKTTLKNGDGSKKILESTNCPCCHSRVRTTGTDRYQVKFQKHKIDERKRIDVEEVTAC